MVPRSLPSFTCMYTHTDQMTCMWAGVRRPRRDAPVVELACMTRPPLLPSVVAASFCTRHGSQQLIVNV